MGAIGLGARDRDKDQRLGRTEMVGGGRTETQRVSEVAGNSERRVRAGSETFRTFEFPMSSPPSPPRCPHTPSSGWMRGTPPGSQGDPGWCPPGEPGNGKRHGWASLRPAPTLPRGGSPLTFFITCSRMRSRSSSISRMSSSSFFGSYTFSSCRVKREARHIERSRATSFLAYLYFLTHTARQLQLPSVLGAPCHS